MICDLLVLVSCVIRYPCGIGSIRAMTTSLTKILSGCKNLSCDGNVSPTRSSWNCDRIRLCLLSVRSRSLMAGF